MDKVLLVMRLLEPCLEMNDLHALIQARNSNTLYVNRAAMGFDSNLFAFAALMLLQLAIYEKDERTC